MKRMLFNAAHAEELRVAIVDGQTLVDLDIEFVNSESKRGNIYKGIVTKVEPSLEAVFVDYGAQRQGFLSLKDISRSYFTKDLPASTPMTQVKIQDAIAVGDSMIVQVEKNERGNKGAALTTLISLAGRFLVLLPNNPRGGGISRQIEGVERHELKEVMAQLELPDEHSIIARTAGIGQTVENFRADLNYLINLWKTIEVTADKSKDSFLIYQESSLTVRTLRDYLRDDIGQIVVDDPTLYEETKKFVNDVMPSAHVEVQFYNDTVPLFSRFQVEHQIKDAFERNVHLPGGGVIVIEQTEALVTIDVNSARSTKGADIEETALQTNLEAVDQIAKHLRVRDIGGLVVIDLIDMSAQRNRRTVEKRFVEAIESDRARTRVGRISQFGLLEMSRQRLRSSIEESSHDKCPRCRGRGFIRSVTSSALSILRIIEEDALKENTELIHAHLPVEVATFLVNEKRHELSTIERRMGTRIIVIPTRSMHTPDHQIVRFTAAELENRENVISYTLQTPDKTPEVYNFIRTGSGDKPAAVSSDDVLTSTKLNKSSSTPLLKRVVKSIFGTGNQEEKPAAEDKEKKPRDFSRKSTPQSRSSSRRGEKHSTGSGSRGRSRATEQSTTQTQGKKGQPAKRKPKVPGNVKQPQENRTRQENSVNKPRPTSGASPKRGNRQSRQPRSRNRETERDSTEKVSI